MQTVDLKHAFRLLNHVPTVLVGSCHAGRANVMAAWAMWRAATFMPLASQ